jgi:hypothetical protein
MTTPHLAKAVADQPAPGQAAASILEGSSTDTASLIALLERLVVIYQQLHDLSRRQGALISNGSAEDLLGVLAQRQQLVDESAKINRELEPYRNEWTRVLDGLRDPERQRVGGLVGRVEELLAGIIEQDNRDRQRLQDATGAVKSELDRVRQSPQAVNAYQAQARLGGNRYTDQRG